MGETCLAEHLGRYVDLSAEEKAALDGLAAGIRHYRRGAVIRSDHGPPGEIYVVRSGWLFSSALLEDGRRQIVRLHFRGDLLGLDSLVFTEAPDAVTALTDAEICMIDRSKLGALFAERPRLGALLFAVQQVDRVALIDRLISLGRGSARGRVAALLLWIASRLRFAGLAVDEGFALPLTQEEIGDLTGLTAVHVNRTMRVLAEQGLIARSGNMLRIPQPGRLARVANHNERIEAIDLAWLGANP
ncbi:Crp/Fnr family transcriptional regulator [Sphingomonas crusticola]|uniref:Crp/Fnr family transcriptional regulator n=1 Tax=Sphingomonas crusticola TaxID=1697973 RepID=UPI000E24CEF4|nr:Crp/Fnr family transcriptional regulator [Sphingomonas crusticola]